MTHPSIWLFKRMTSYVIANSSTNIDKTHLSLFMLQHKRMTCSCRHRLYSHCALLRFCTEKIVYHTISFCLQTTVYIQSLSTMFYYHDYIRNFYTTVLEGQQQNVQCEFFSPSRESLNPCIKQCCQTTTF